MRFHRSLAGRWQFQLDPQGAATPTTLAPDREIDVPLPWQAAFPDLRQYSGYAWYRRTFDLTPDWLAGEVLLHFGAVDYWCQVFVNGQLVGEHEGGYTPFTLPIRRYGQAGTNELAVRVYDSAQDGLFIPRWPNFAPNLGAGGPPFDAAHIPHGKQEWYINVGGIWQDVTLTAVPATYIDQVHVWPDIHTGQAHVHVELGGAPTGGNLTTVEVTDSAGTRVETTVPLAPGQTAYNTTLTVDAPTLWDMDNPHLYTATVRVGDDEMATRFGFREITTQDGRLLLNGEPLYLLSALDQDLYPDTIYTVPSEDYLRDEFQKAKHLGLNNLRCHIKPPDPRYLDLADEMGLLVWAEIPSWRTFFTKGTVHRDQLALDEAIKRRVEQTLEEMVRRDFNHPSLIIWTIVNEDWGTSLPLSAEDRAWVAAMVDRCKALDPTRLVVDNSACGHAWGPNIHVKSDLDDFHVYANIPDQARNFERTVEQFGLRPLWTYSSQGDAQRTGREPLILSEFGNWGLPSLRALRQADGSEPAWFDIGAWWSPWEGEAGWPSGVEARFAQLGLDKIWADYEAYATATQWHQFEAMQFEIEAMRRQPAISGYVITEFTDAYWESNGLLDFERQPKVYHDVFASLNAPDVLAPQPERYAAWDDERLRVCVHGSHYSRADWSGACLRFEIGDDGPSGETETPPLARGEVAVLGLLRARLPQMSQAETVALRFALHAPDGRSLAQSHVNILTLPAAARQPAYRLPLAVVGSDAPFRTAAIAAAPSLVPSSTDWGAPDDVSGPSAGGHGEGGGEPLESALRRLGYPTTDFLSADTAVAVSNYPSADLLRWVRDGGRLLYLSAGPSPFFWTQGRGGAYSGSWISSFTWLRPDVHRRLPVSNPLGLPFMRIMPLRTILGLPVEDAAVQPDFLAGMISGWVRHPAVHTVQFRYGKGRVVMTTFALREMLRQEPVAVAMLHDLIDHLASDACEPTLRANY